jgi:hypothetical protein
MSGPFPVLTFDELVELTGGRFGIHDVACLRCGPQRRLAANRRRAVLRIWRCEPGFATYCCARCGIGGYAFADNRATLSRDDRARIARAQAKAEAFDREEAAKRLELARWLCRAGQSPGRLPSATCAKYAASPGRCQRRSASCQHGTSIRPR